MKFGTDIQLGDAVKMTFGKTSLTGKVTEVGEGGIVITLQNGDVVTMWGGQVIGWQSVQTLQRLGNLAFMMTPAEFAAKHGVSRQRVMNWLEDGRIEGATRTRNRWLIPAGAPRPSDRRRKS